MSNNALIHEKSPYLLQHAGNPVDWMPWGDAAFERARREQKPIFLSIGYSTCHWCHVMERESFENQRTAELLNASFVSIKVDREERPDVDRIYMLFVQATSGSGGWPMSVWLTPELKPFFGGTYFPPETRYGRPGFPDVLEQIARAWHENRDKIEASSERIREQLREHLAGNAATGSAAPVLDTALFESAYWPMRRSFDAEWGGFGGAPKFPRPAALTYLLRYYAAKHDEEALEMTTGTLDAMAAGGMHDQLGGGFHRYSVDRHWFVPHFEKMLYDQAQLAVAYVEAFQVTRDERHAQIARGIFEYVLRDMRDSQGAFYSAEDADSTDPENAAHKGEGAFYIWRQLEIDTLLDRRTAAWFNHRFGVMPEGNVTEDPQAEFTGRNILYRAFDEEQTAKEYQADAGDVKAALAQARRKLLEARGQRPRPHLDDKVLTAWNGLMISALAQGARILGDATYLDAARRAAEFVRKTMFSTETGILLRRYRDGSAAVEGFLDDYACFAEALLDLYEADFDAQHLVLASRLAKEGFARFEDPENGGFFSTQEGDANLLLRMKEDYDGAEPAANSVAIEVLIRLAHLTGDDAYRARAARALEAFAPKLRQQPVSSPRMLAALGRMLAAPAQVVLRCAEVDHRVLNFAAAQWREFAPNRTLAVVTDAGAELLRDVAPFLAGLSRTSAITVYECENFVCRLPRELV